MKVSIVILNWNRPNETLECLESIKELNLQGVNLYVYVVDNASEDDSVAQLTDYHIPCAKYELLVNKANLGYAGGNNVGIRHALQENSDYIMVLNNDTWIEKNTLRVLVDCAKKDKEIGVVSPKIYFAKGFEFHKQNYKRQELGRVIWYAGGTVDWNNVYGENRGVDEVDSGQFDKSEIVDFASGTCSLFKSSVLRKVGLFDENYFLYFEDTDLSVRIGKAGYKVIYCPDGIVMHKVSQSSGIGSNLNDYFLTRNRLYFAHKYAGIRAKFALFRESIKFLLKGRNWQKIGVRDYYLRKFGKGSY